MKQWIAVAADVPDGEQVFVPLYEAIRGNVHKLYNGMKLTGTTLFRLTRDAEVAVDDESDSDETLLDVVREQVRLRRYEPVVQLEFAPGADPSIRKCCGKDSDFHPWMSTIFPASWTTRLCSRFPRCPSRIYATNHGIRCRRRA